MRVLVTNDDGIEAVGLHVLAAALIEAGHEVVVAAPAKDCSGQGAAVGPLHLTGTVEFERRVIPGVAADAFAVDGPPALAAMAGCLGGFGPAPTVVVSGINAGANTGRAVIHSGTVGAALTAVNLGFPAIAVSQSAASSYRWESAATIAVELVPYALRLSQAVALNLNVPNLALEDVRGLSPATLDVGGRSQAVMVGRSDGVLELRYPERQRPSPDSDVALLDGGHATLSAIVGPQSVGIDLGAMCGDVETLLAQISARRISA